MCRSCLRKFEIMETIFNDVSIRSQFGSSKVICVTHQIVGMAPKRKAPAPAPPPAKRKASAPSPPLAKAKSGGEPVKTGVSSSVVSVQAEASP